MRKGEKKLQGCCWHTNSCSTLRNWVFIKFENDRISYRFIAFCGYWAHKNRFQVCYRGTEQERKKGREGERARKKLWIESIDGLTTVRFLLCAQRARCCLLYRRLLVECMRWIDNTATEQLSSQKCPHSKKKKEKKKTTKQLSRKIFRFNLSDFMGFFLAKTANRVFFSSFPFIFIELKWFDNFSCISNCNGWFPQKKCFPLIVKYFIVLNTNWIYRIFALKNFAAE